MSATQKIAVVSRYDYFVTNVFETKEEAADELMYDVEEIITFLNSDGPSELGFLRYIEECDKAKKKKPEYIIQIDPNTGNVVNVFNNIRAACEHMNTRSIINAISGEGKKAKGYLWKDNRNIVWHLLQQSKPSYLGAKILYYKIKNQKSHTEIICYSLDEIQRLTGLFWGEALECIRTKSCKKGYYINVGGLTDDFTTAIERYNKYEMVPVVQMTYRLKQPLIIYASDREAELLNNLQLISACIKGNLKSSGGYIWRKYNIGLRRPIMYKDSIKDSESKPDIFADAVERMHNRQQNLETDE